ncbi:MAG: hypothetical protein IPK19_27770 [Chloroflexi bacterium]|nr:hypothetical protein [Chloroflexota bacterium]
MAHVERAIAATPGIHRVEVTFDADIERVRRYIPATFGQLTAVSATTTHLMCFAQSLPWIAGYFAGIPLPITILQPPALKEALCQLADRVADILARSAVEE